MLRTDSRRSARKGLVIALAASVMALASVPLVRAISSMADGVAPNDTVTIEKMSDGTHDGAGTETFVSSKNGFAVADDTPDDGVVASGDVVTYSYDLSIVAGRARTVSVRFTQTDGGALNLADFGRVAMSGNVVSGRYSNGTWTYSVPRGASGHVRATFNVRANDTGGKVVGGNVITATLTNEDMPSYQRTSKTEPVTVVSVPFADLTLDAVYNRDDPRTYTQSMDRGAFDIEPARLGIDGYSDNGFTASGEWHTDVDVSELPDGTRWTANGKALEVVDGRLKDLRGRGRMQLFYELPESARPSDDDPKSVYTIHLEPYADSFKAGDAENVRDPGEGEGVDYDTSKHTINGVNVHAPKGAGPCGNNNYSTAVWRYEPPVTGDIWRYDVMVPRNRGEALYDEGNVHWDDAHEYYQQGERTLYQSGDLKCITSDNDMYGMLTIDSRGLKGIVGTDRIAIGDMWDANGTTGTYRDSHYDTTRDVVVTHEGTPIDVDRYVVQWRTVPDGVTSLDDDVSGATPWVTSNKAPNVWVNQCRVLFREGAFDNTSGLTRIYIPTKARDDYDPTTDSQKLINARGLFAINATPTSDGVSGNEYGDKFVYNEVLKFPSIPTVRADVSVLGKKNDVIGGCYRATFRIEDRVDGPSTAHGYDATRTLTFDPAYDASTFYMTKSNGWVVDSIVGSTVTIRRSGFDLEHGYGMQGYGIGDVEFFVMTKMNLNQEGKDKVSGSVREEVSLSYPRVGPIPTGVTKGTDTATNAFDVMREVSTILTADAHKAEVGDDIGWTLDVSADMHGFSQDVLLPSNGDNHAMIPLINQVNGSHIDIDEETGEDRSGYMDGIGRTRADGSYSIKSITLERFASDTTVELRTQHGKVNLSVDHETGVVDLSPIAGLDIGVQETYGLVFSSNTPMSDVQGTGVRAHITLTPKGNAAGNDYVAWVGRTRSYGMESGNPFNDPNHAIADEMSWPDYTSIVASTVSGVVWNDDDSNGWVDGGENGYAGVHVRLLRKADDGGYVDTGRETVTDGEGRYRFDGLHSGEYRVLLPNIERAPGSDAVSKVCGLTGPDAKDGSLAQGRSNRFDVFEPTVQTYSVGAYRMYSRTQTDVTLGVGEDRKDVNYGFRNPNADLSLDKSAARVTNGTDGTSVVEWDVTVRNDGNEDVSGAVLSDRTSNDVIGLDASLGYLEGGEDLGVPLDVAGNGMTVWSKDSYSGGDAHAYTILVSGEGTFLVESDPNGSGRTNVRTVTGVTGLTGEVLEVYDQDEAMDYRPFVVRTSDGLFVVEMDGTARKLGVEGAVRSVVYKSVYDMTVTTDTHIYAYSNVITDDKHASANTDNVTYLYNDGMLQFAFTEDGRILYGNKTMGGCGRLLEYSEDEAYDDGMRVAVTTNGYYLCAAGKGVMKLGGAPDGEFVGLMRNNIEVIGHVGIVTTRGMYSLCLADGKFTKVNGNNVLAKGASKEHGDHAARHDHRKMSVTLTRMRADGTNVSQTHRVITDGTLSKAELFADDTLSFQFDNGDTFLKTDNMRSVVGTSGRVLRVSSVHGARTILTTDGLYVSDPFTDGGNGTWPFRKLWSVPPVFHEDQSVSPSERTPDGTTTKRTYKLPKIPRGQSVTLHLKGTVIQGNEPKVVGNQAWVTSPMTPRDGIERTDPATKVTGTGMPPGVPDAFELPDPKHFDGSGIKGTPTVRLNSDIGHDESPVDDLADQTPALIGALATHDAPETNRILNGYAWYDDDGNGLRDDGNPAVGIRVTVTNAQHPNVRYDATTGPDGHWEITGMMDGEYQVHYEVVGHVHDGKVWTATISNPTDPMMNSDIDRAGYVTESVPAIESGESGRADAGLTSVSAGIGVTKGFYHDGGEGKDDDAIYGDRPLTEGTEATDVDAKGVGEALTGRVDDGDGDPRTQAYSYTVANTGAANLTDVRVTDRTVEGNDARLGGRLTYYPDGMTPDTEQSYAIDGDGYVTSSDGTRLTMAPGSKLVGAYDVPFTTGHDAHSDEMTVTASIMDGGDVIGTVDDRDTARTRYEHRPTRTLRAHKVGDAPEGGEEDLGGVSFKVERMTGNDGYKTVGTYVTDSDGRLELRLGSGEYRVTEVGTTDGYRLPDGCWELSVGYDKDGNVLATIGGDAVALAHIADGEGDTEWCSLTIHNKRMPTMFGTGEVGAVALLSVATVVAVVSTRSVVVRRRRRALAMSGRDRDGERR